MASARRRAQALHSTNLRVNAKRFASDTFRSRLPDRAWLEHRLDQQFQSDAVQQDKLDEHLLRKTGLSMERSFASLRSLKRYRKKLLGAFAPPGAPAQRQAQPLTCTAANARSLSW
jgi:hypothetical protein